MTMLVQSPSSTMASLPRNAFGHEASRPDSPAFSLFDFSGRVLGAARAPQSTADCTCGTCAVCVAAGGGYVSPRDNSQQRASPRRPPRPSLLRTTRSAEHINRRPEFDAFDVTPETASSLVKSLGAAAAGPPPGAKLTDGEWVWMTSEDWRLLEEFTQAASGATEMLKEQRSALEAAEKSPSGSGGALVLTGEEVLLKELQQMRLQLAATQAEKSRLEQDNAELLKNCHFLHSQNVELKAKKASRPRLNLGQSAFPRKSQLSQMDSTAEEADPAEEEGA